MKIEKDTILKIAGMALTIGGMIVTNVTGKKDQEKALEKIVDEKLKNK